MKTTKITVAFFGVLLCLSVIVSFSSDEDIAEPIVPAAAFELGADLLHNLNIALEADIVNDFFPPPVAGRIYLYPNLLMFEVLSQNEKELRPISDVNPNIPKIERHDDPVVVQLSALLLFHKIANELVYTNKNLKAEISKLKNFIQQNPELSESLAEAELYCGKLFPDLMEWVNTDNYLETRNAGDYELKEEIGSWLPTPPDYLDALEPHWSSIRPIFLDSANQFRPINPTKYDLTPGSQFHTELMEVYDVVNNRTDSMETVAKFWDCNPIVMKHQGHITFSEKKLTPGGHWFNIGRMACEKEELNLLETAYVYAGLSIGIFDAFISCWDGKYVTNYIRPVTVIQNHIDPSWSAILVTPNFPEYTSGHSVVSRSASTVLTHFFGDNYAFIDSTEVPYGMPPRLFPSFQAASDEAAISRLYGGIHFAPAIDLGVEQGAQVGQLTTSHLKANPF